MYFSTRPGKDGTITDLKIRGISKTGSNSGRSEILELYRLTESTDRRGKSRILLHFDLSLLSSSIASGLIPTSSVEYSLYLKNANHSDSVPYSYDIKIYALSQSWDEGRGLSMEDEDLKDFGVANWDKATNSSLWNTAGGHFLSAAQFTASQHFDYGTEDLNVDISKIVYSWLTGGLTNYGLLLKFDDFYETGSSDYYVKKFFSRHALVAERVPRLDCKWEKNLQDDRSELPYQITSSLVYYRFLGGAADSINQPVFVDIFNSSSTVVQTLTASVVDTGIYQISGVFITHTSSTQIYRDVWFTSDRQLFTGTFAPVFKTGSQMLTMDDISINLPNLKPIYDSDERVLIRVFAKEKDYKTAVVRNAILEPNPILLKNAYYQIENAETEEVIVCFSTGTLKYSKLSYDAEGNYFDLWTSALPPGSIYKIKILTDYNSKRFIFDKNWTFKIQ